MSRKVMIIDDSITIRQTVGMALKSAGFNTIEAVDGSDALEKAKTEDIGLFICDVNMPNMNGITFLKSIKASATHKYTPVIMLTTENCRDMILKGKEEGAKAWMIKPFRPEALLEAVKKLMIV